MVTSKNGKTDEDFIIKQIELSSEEAGNKGEVIAVSENLNHSSKVGIQVLQNFLYLILTIPSQKSKIILLLNIMNKDQKCMNYS